MVSGFKDKNDVFHPTGNDGGKKSPENKSIEPKPMKIVFATDEQIQRAKSGDPRGNRNIHQRLSLTKEEQEENIESGISIIVEFQTALDQREDDFFEGKTIDEFLENQNPEVRERWLEQLGRDEDKFREFLDNRLQKKKGVWNLAIPISTQGANEDGLSSNYTTKSNKGRIFWGNISPEDFLELASPVGTFSEEIVEIRQKQIRDGKPIDTPFLDITWDDIVKRWKVRSHEGRHRSEASRREGLDNIPVWIELDESIWELNNEQEDALNNSLSGIITTSSFVRENA